MTISARRCFGVARGYSLDKVINSLRLDRVICTAHPFIYEEIVQEYTEKYKEN